MSVDGLEIALDVLNDRMAVTVSDDAPIVMQLSAACREALGREPDRAGTAFFSDASIFLKHRPLDVVLFGPGESSLAHTPNESVSLTAYRDSVRAYQALIGRWAREGS